MIKQISGRTGYLGLIGSIGIEPGQISAQNVIAALEEMRAAGVNDVTVDIHSDGGSMLEGFAIYDALVRFPGKITTNALNAFSIASVIAMAGDVRTMSENGHHMIHFGRGVVEGTAKDMRVTADLVDKLSDRMVAIYSEKTQMPEEVIRAAMEKETWFDSKQAMTTGLAQSLTAPNAMVAYMDTSRFNLVPFDKVEKSVGNGLADTTNIEARCNMKATIKEMKARFNTNLIDSDFLVAQLEKESTMAEADEDYIKFLEGEAAQKQEYEARCKAMEDEMQTMKAEMGMTEEDDMEAMVKPDKMKSMKRMRAEDDDDDDDDDEMPVAQTDAPIDNPRSLKQTTAPNVQGAANAIRSKKLGSAMTARHAWKDLVNSIQRERRTNRGNALQIAYDTRPDLAEAVVAEANTRL